MRRTRGLAASAQNAEASAKIAMPRIRSRLRPKRSPAAPPRSRRALTGKRYALITHCRVALSAPKEARIAGKPTLTTEPSTKARLEARIGVAKLRLGCCGFG